VIRPATPTDGPAVAALDAVLFGPDAWAVDSVAAELCGERRRGVVALDGSGLLVGYAVTVLAGHTADLTRIAVARAHRRGGLARAMLRTVCRLAAEDGASRVLLEVAADNAGALALYTTEGFAEVGRRRRYYRDGRDALVLGRPLVPADVRGAGR
jgi:ribosomal-protein-alanine N-acetyltransferase